MHKDKMTLFSLCFVLILSLCLSASIEAKQSDYIAKLTEIKGEVFVTTGGGIREFIAENDTVLTQGDRVRTGENASVTFVISNKSAIVMGAHSQIMLSELAPLSTVIKLSYGELWNESLSSTEDRFHIEVPAAVIAVHGTIFHVDVDVDTSTVRVLDGIVEVTPHQTAEAIKVGTFEQLKIDLQDSVFDVAQLDIDSPPSGGSGNRTTTPDPDPITEPEVTRTWIDTDEDETQLYVKVEGFPHDKPIVALQLHLAFVGGSNIDIEALVSSGMTVTSNLLGTANLENQAQVVKGFNSNGIHPAELMIAQTFFGQALTSGYVITGNETISVDLSSMKHNYTGPFEIQIIEAMFIDRDGQPIAIEIDPSMMEIN